MRRRCVKGGAFASYRPSLSGTLSLSTDREADQRESAPGRDGFQQRSEVGEQEGVEEGKRLGGGGRTWMTPIIQTSRDLTIPPLSHLQRRVWLGRRLVVRRRDGRVG